MIDSTGYNYPEELMVLDAGNPTSYTVLLAIVEDGPMECDECNRNIDTGIWAYYVDEDDGVSFHPPCLIKPSSSIGHSVLIRNA